MDEPHLYQKIAESIRGQIMQGDLKPGDRLPPVRHMTGHWECTPGTVQRAYHELALQGLVISRSGQGTRVTGKLHPNEDTPLRRAVLINRAEAFLLEIMTNGYSPSEIEQAFHQGLNRWRTIEQTPRPIGGSELIFSGSHDIAVDWLASNFHEISPQHHLLVSFNGSLGGLMALSEGKADLAGCHLWDRDSNSYNTPFIRRILPGKQTALITLAHRRLGLIVPPGNPKKINDLISLTRPDVRFVNRQPGSGTRVWLDSTIKQSGINPFSIQGYSIEKLTHSDVARAVASMQADVGLGLETSSLALGLDFVFLTRERFDLATIGDNMALPVFKSLVEFLQNPPTRAKISSLGGYDTSQSGDVEWVN
jgi:molybdate-binding protein/DNA-binding transcriptional regulator YhcF (GntR family)